MELSIYTNFFADLPLEKALVKLVDAGFHYAELDRPIPFPDPNARGLSRQVERLRAHCESIGIKPRQAHGYWGEYSKTGSPAWKKRLALFRKEIAVSADLGVEVIVAHPMLKREIDKGLEPGAIGCSPDELLQHSVELYSELIPALETSGVQIAIENMPSLSEGFCTIDELMELISALRSKSFGICMDTGHLFQACGDPGRFIQKAGKRLIATHVHDTLNLTGYDLHLFPLLANYCDNWVNWNRVRHGLRQVGYKGTFNLETPGEGPTSGAPLWLREMKLRFVHESLTRFLAETEDVL